MYYIHGRVKTYQKVCHILVRVPIRHEIVERHPLVGQKTTRLQLQMQTVRIDQMQSERAEGDNEEMFYAATQAQAARTAYQDVTAEQHGGSEQTTGSDQLPLAYRDAARQYTVRQHDRESTRQP